MTVKTAEKKFIDWVVSLHPNLNEERIFRKGSGEGKPHVRFSSGCGINSSEEFLKLFEGLDYSPMSENEFSKTYTIGGRINWAGNNIGVLYGIAKEGHSERKRWTPESLGFGGYSTDNITDFKNKIIDGLKNIGEQEIDLFINLLSNIESKTPIKETSFLKNNKSKITSDFGEILAAYDDVNNGFKIKFSSKSNQKVIDYSTFIENEWKDISVKNPKGGGKVNLSDYVDLIDCTDPKNIPAHILYAIGSYNRDKLFELAALDCAQVKKISEIVGGTSKEARMKYVKEHSYDEFYDQIKSNKLFVLKHEPLGVPNQQEWKPNELTPKAMWENGSLHPIDFTLNTLISRFWGESNVEGISKVVVKFLNKPKFKIVDIVNGNVIISEVEFKHVNKWKTIYWSRATSAWHNWMAVEPVKEKYD